MFGNASSTSSTSSFSSSSRHHQHQHQQSQQQHNRRGIGSGSGGSSTSAASSISAISSSLLSAASSVSGAAAAAGSLDVYSAENSKLLAWIKEQLESRGIDSVVYGRYILSMLLMNSGPSKTTTTTNNSTSASASLNSNSSSADSSSSLSSSESSIEKSLTAAGDSSSGSGDGDSGYGTSTGGSSTTISTTTKQKPSLSTTLSSSSSAEKGGRFCDLHQRLYPGLNLHQSRTKLLRESVLGGSKSAGLNTQKPASTTKFMHRRYQPLNGGISGGSGSGRGSPTDHFLSVAASDSGHLPEENNHCPDCAARNNYGNAAASRQVANVSSSSFGVPPPPIDYRKVVLADCLKDVFVDGQDSIISVDSFVDDLVGRFDRLRSQNQQQEQQTSSSSSNRHQGQSNSFLGGGGIHNKSNYHSSSNSSSSVKLFGHSKSFEQSTSESASGTRGTDSTPPWPRLSDSSLNSNSNHHHHLHHHHQQQNNAPPAPSQYQQHNNSRSSSNSSYHQHNPNQQQHRSTSFQPSGKPVSSFHRSLSEDNNNTGGQESIHDQTANTTTSSTHQHAISAEKPPQIPNTRDQALKYFAAFPALSGKFGSLSATASNNNGGGGRSSSMSRQPSLTAALNSISSPLKSSTTSLAKMSSAQSSLDDSVFSEDQTSQATAASSSGASSQSGEHASWNGLKIIKTISGKSGNVAGGIGISSASTSTLTGSSSGIDLIGGNSSQLTIIGGASGESSVSGAAATKPPTLLSGGKSRIIVPTAPSTLLLDSSRESSNFTTLKKKVVSAGSGSSGSGSGSSSSISGVSGGSGLNRKSSTTTSSSSLHLSTSTTSNSEEGTKSSSSALNPKTTEVVSREQEKIFNIMPSYMNPFKSSGGGSNNSASTSSTNSNSSSSAKSSSNGSLLTSSRRLPPPQSSQSSTASVVSGSHKTTASASTSTSTGLRQQSAYSNSAGTTTFVRQPQPASLSSGGRTANTSGKTAAIVRSGLLQTASSVAMTAANDGDTSSSSSSSRATSISSAASSTTTTTSSAVDLLPSFLKSHSGFAAAAAATGNSGNSRQPPASAAKQQLKSGSGSAATWSTAALGDKVEDAAGCSSSTTALSAAFTCTTARTTNTRAGTTTTSKLLNDTETVADAVADDAYQQRKVVQNSAPTSTTTRSSQQSSSQYFAAYQQQQKQQPYHHQQQPQLQQCEVKPDLRNNTNAQASASSFTSSALSSQSQLSSLSSSSLSTTTEKEAAGNSGVGLTATNASSATVVDRQQQSQTLTLQPQQQSVTMISHLPHHSSQSRGNLETKSNSNNSSSANAGRLLNDYWFDFIEEDHNSSLSSTAAAQLQTLASNKKEGVEKEEVLRLSADDHQQPSSMVKDCGDQSQAQKAEEPSFAAEYSQQQQQQPPAQLVIDSKGALDEWMNSILAAQKLRRGNSVGKQNAAEQHHHHPKPPANDHSANITETALMTFEEVRPTAQQQQTLSSLPTSEGIQDFLDSIRQSIKTTSSSTAAGPSINCWKPLDCNSEAPSAAVGSGLERRKPSFDCVSYYWNQNCTLGYLGGGSGSSSSAFEGSSAAGNNGNKSFRQYLDEQMLHQSEISLIAELFAQSQQQQQSSSFLPASTFSSHHSSLFGGPPNDDLIFDPLFSSTSTSSSAAPARRISLANHETESSAFQEVILTDDQLYQHHNLTRPSRTIGDSAELPQEKAVASVSPSGQTSSSAASATSSTYFQPIDCPVDEAEGQQLLTSDPTASDWLALFAGAPSEQSTSLAIQQQSSTSTSTFATTTMNKNVRALKATSMQSTTATSTTTANSSAAASRSISVSRAELETYFTPTTELCSSANDGVCEGDCEQTTTNAEAQSLGTSTTAAKFYSTSPPLTTVNKDFSTHTSIISAQRIRRRSSSFSATPSLLLTAVEKLSNSACACKSACGGHFVESACCCVPDEYHCRLDGSANGAGGNGDLSPSSLSADEMRRMCDKSTTTSTDHLLDAVKETLLDCLGQQQHQQKSADLSPSSRQRLCGSPMMDPSSGFFASLMNANNNSHPFLAASFAGDGNNDNSGNFNTAATSKDLFKDDEEELNVNDLVNSVLRLTTVEEDSLEGMESFGEQLMKPNSSFQPPCGSLFEVFADHSASLSPIMSFGGDGDGEAYNLEVLKSKLLTNGVFDDPSMSCSPLQSFDLQKITKTTISTTNKSNSDAVENKNKKTSGSLLDYDDYDGPPMPYSKRKKLLQQKLANGENGKSEGAGASGGSNGPLSSSTYVYGQFPLSGEQMEQLRAMVSQNKPLSNLADLSSGNSIVNKRPSLNSSASTSTSTLSTSRNDLSNGAGNNTIYYSNRNSHQSVFGGAANDSGFVSHSQQHQSPPPPLGSSPLFEADSLLDVSTGGFGGDHHGLPYGDFYDAEEGGKSTDDYVIGPDGAQYYVGGSGGEDAAGDQVDGEATGARSSGSGYSAEELFAQYGADAYAVIQHEELPLMQHGKQPGSSASQQYMFDLKFKTSSRTIDNTIESTAPLKQSQKPVQPCACRFFMEGFCARGDCKFSHDLSSITCKYWQEGFCIKEGACPFLHGYPAETKKPPTQQSKLDPNAKSFQFKIESDHDFPALAGGEEESGLDVLDASKAIAADFPSLGDSVTSSSSLQQLFLNGGGSNTSAGGHQSRVNFTVAGHLSGKVSGGGGKYGNRPHSKSNYASNGSSAVTTNGHAANADEEWPSLNGDSGLGGGGLLNGNSTGGGKSATATADKSAGSNPFGGGFHDRVNFREKVIKSKKSKGGSRGGNAASSSASNNSNSSSGANAAANSGGKFALKGLL